MIVTKKKKNNKTNSRKNCDSDSDDSDDLDSDDDIAAIAKSKTEEELMRDFENALAAQSCIAGATNNYISGHGAVVEAYRYKRQTKTKNSSTSKVVRGAKKRKVENSDDDEDDDENENKHQENEEIDYENDGVPFCFLVLDEVDTPGSGWVDRKSKALLEKILSVNSIGIILIANRTHLTWLPPQKSQYLTFSPYDGDDLAQIAKQKMSLTSKLSSNKNNNNGKNQQQSNNSNENKNNNNSSSIAPTVSFFNDSALTYVGMYVAKNQAGDVRKVTDHCKTAVANKILSWHQEQQQQQQQQNEKRSREEVERSEAELMNLQNKSSKSTIRNKTTAKTVLLDQQSSASSSTRTSTNSLNSESNNTNSVLGSNLTRNSKNTKSSSLLDDQSATNANALMNLLNQNNNNNSNQQQGPSLLSFDIKAKDMMLAAKSSTAHPGIAMLPMLPSHAQLALCCVANAVKANHAAIEQRQQQMHMNNFSNLSGTKSKRGSCASGGNNQNSASNNNDRLVELNSLFTLYQNVTRKMGMTSCGLPLFRDSLESLVDTQLLAVNSKSVGTFYTMTVHQDEIEPELKKLGTMYLLADELAKKL